jgi:hypothetical protein
MALQQWAGLGTRKSKVKGQLGKCTRLLGVSFTDCGAGLIATDFLYLVPWLLTAD